MGREAMGRGIVPTAGLALVLAGDAHTLRFRLTGRIGGRDAAVVGIANGWLRYLPHARNFEEPLADQKYEILQSTLVPDASERLLAEAERLDQLLANGPTK